MIDIFFALVAASLPVLNAITHKRRRFTSSSLNNLNPVGAAPIDAGSQRAFHRSESVAEAHELSRYLGRLSKRDHLDDESADYSQSDNIYPPQQPAAWNEFGQDVTCAVPTHQVKMNNDGRLSGD